MNASVMFGVGLLDQTDFMMQGLGRRPLEQVVEEENESQAETVDASLSYQDQSKIKIHNFGAMEPTFDGDDDVTK